jgi:diaminohydroxyphosphoribosylaminopyrimidine deaminase/5-amino-6-(5-phosphoribosylamino)uracil reductase
VIVLPNAHGKVALGDLMNELGRRQLNEVHVEAGFTLNGSLLREGLVVELLVYLAPSLLGASPNGMFNLAAIDTLAQRTALRFTDVARVGPDVRLIARVGDSGIDAAA